MALDTRARVAWITGSGMLGSALADALCSHGYAVALSPRSLLNLDDRDRLRTFARQAQPDLVLHSAALTRVNYCQSHPDEALAVNGVGVANIVHAAREVDAQLVLFSTDYVFDGGKNEPWTESDTPSPINAYGESKLAGERAALSYQHGHVVRTSGVFGARCDGSAERNFFRAIAEKLLRHQPLDVVSDQSTAVTYAPHLAAMLLAMLAAGMPRIVHLTSGGIDSWYGWARHAAELLGLKAADIRPCERQDSDDATPRPRYSVLGSEISIAADLAQRYSALAGIAEYYAGESGNWYP